MKQSVREEEGEERGGVLQKPRPQHLSLSSVHLWKPFTASFSSSALTQVFTLHSVHFRKLIIASLQCINYLILSLVYFNMHTIGIVFPVKTIYITLYCKC